ncbi:alpha/beta hydrolase [Streptomyces geranii]|uniref:alpha/beta hydrolase n=1 Tax=Streptomyces geranii TaxID=2058923 RepID=UPI000D027FD8|nr:alpha/beta hydrolase-fold protein [Streptomyces geranii]
MEPEDEPEEELDVELDVELEFDVIDPPGRPEATVIWLHGMGQDSGTLAPVAHRTGLTRPGSRVRHVFPRAPRQSPGLAGGVPARAWFRQRVFSLKHADLPTLLATEQALHRLVSTESALTGPKRVLLAGFSQGASMALITALRHPERLGGLMLYDPFLTGELALAETRSPANSDLPVWIGQGRFDWVVPLAIGESVRDLLNSWEQPLSWHVYYDYPNNHEPFSGAAADLRAFFDDVVAGGGGPE